MVWIDTHNTLKFIFNNLLNTSFKKKKKATNLECVYWEGGKAHACAMYSFRDGVFYHMGLLD